jgi:hypothetical protein
MSDDGEIFLCALEILTKMARSIGASPREVANRDRSRSWIVGYLKKQHTGRSKEELRAIVDSLQKAKLSDEIPDLLPGERHRGVREDSYEECSDPVWVTRAHNLFEVSRLPRSMFEICLLAKRLWGWESALTENVVVYAETKELIEFRGPAWVRVEGKNVEKKKPHRTRQSTKTLTLPVAVDEHEQLKLVKARSGLLSQRQAIEEEQKQATAGFRQRIQEVERQLERNDNVVRNGFEFRPVECSCVSDLDDGVMRVVRLDTQQLVEERALTEEESQLTLDDQLPSERATA